MEIFGKTAAIGPKRAAKAALITAAAGFSVALLAPPLVVLLAASARPGEGVGIVERLSDASTVALCLGVYVFFVIQMPTRVQQRLVWVTLALMFLGFFHSFDLSIAYILNKLPYLLTVGMVTTLYVSAAAITLAFLLALAGAVAKLSGFGIAMGIGSFYTSYFRGVPLLTQLFLIYAGLPQIGFVIDPVPAGIVALSLCYGAYMTEVFRAGINSIPKGQWEAADALGLPRGRTFRLVILPQALRLIVPPTGNQFIAMLKDSSLVSVVGVWDLMFVARAQGRAEFKTLEMLIIASVIYWMLSIVLELVQSRIEYHFNASDRRAPAGKPSAALSKVE